MVRNKGFTIVELLIVVVVIAILAAITIVAYNGVQQQAQRSVVASDVRNVNQKVEAHKVLKGAYPGSITDCPTPAATNLCYPSGAATVTYTAIPEGVINGGYTMTTEASYEISVQSDKAFTYYSPATKTSNSREFVQYVDLAPFIDRYGLVPYVLSFDIKSDDITERSTIQVYFQNGSDAKYGNLGPWVDVTTEWTHKELTFTPTLVSAATTRSMLAFYGVYETGNKPSVRNLHLELKG